MERKGGTGSVAVTVEEVRSALGRARTLSSEEEKVLRMRHGAAVPDLRAPLPRAAGNNEELADELLLLEMQLLRAMKARKAPATTVAPAAAPTQSRVKDKIVRALRKKK
jgi:hypothetical protein